MKIFKKIIVLFIIFMLTGCFDYKELNNLAIITKMAIDKNGDEFEVSFSIENTKSNTESNIIYTAAGKSISEAINNIQLTLPKKIYTGHLSIIIINEELAKNNLNQLINYLIKSKEYSQNFYLALSKDKSSKETINEISNLETKLSKNILSDINNEITFSDFLKTLIKPGIDPVLPVITIKDNTIDVSSTLALFNNYKLVAFSNENQSKGINLIYNKTKEMIIPIKSDNKNIATIKLSNINTKTKIKNNTIININIKANYTIKEINYEIKKQTLNEIKNKTKNEIKKLIQEGIEISKNNDIDIFGFGNMIYKNNASYFNRIKDTWGTEFKKINPNIKINLITDDNLQQTTIKENNNSWKK